MSKILISVEGQTEEKFVKELLVPHFERLGIFITPKVLMTKRVRSGPNFKGGFPNYENIKREIQILLRDSSAKIVTTMYDFYGLPKEFPKEDSNKNLTSIQKVETLEQNFKAEFNDSRFFPYFALHEFEALLFSEPENIASVLNEKNKAKELEKVKNKFSTPEEINENPNTAPSKRIEKIFPAYQKPTHGILASKEIGLKKMMEECPHFCSWVNKLKES
ncbi:MAG: DUF4276 family protein [Calditrichaeota bacterium]|nr:MAG: DUF4276 family protein [Calditrichota bacterium]